VLNLSPGCCGCQAGQNPTLSRRETKELSCSANLAITLVASYRAAAKFSLYYISRWLLSSLCLPSYRWRYFTHHSMKWRWAKRLRQCWNSTPY